MTGIAAADAAPTGAMAVIATLFEVRTGQHLAANRSWRLDTALKPLLRDRGLETIDALVVQLLDGKDSKVGDRIVEVLLNQETSFFRDGPVIDAAVEAIAALEPYRPGMRTRIWSAGCSFGQEPLSLAMAFAERGGAVPEIIATDLSDGAIQRARSGRFTQFEIQRGLPIRRMMRWFDGASESGGEEWTAKAELLRHVAFRRQNLVADRPPTGPFDAVFCRNVLFYLTPTHRAHVLRSIASVLRPGGLLVLGAGETVLGQTELFEPSRRFRGLYETIVPPAAVRRAG